MVYQILYKPFPALALSFVQAYWPKSVILTALRAKSIAKYAGLVWTNRQSGKFEAEETKMIRSCNHYLRFYLVEAAKSVKRVEPEFHDYYLKKYREVSKHQHKRTLVLNARKLVRLSDALLRNEQVYTPRRKVNR
ncbi:MAG: hypothetical protein PWR12_1480 [Eubacteriaceae bacterium]|nr:hypothetical protein [Eubacteriaceae bacterium]